jgi:hypothetical protein
MKKIILTSMIAAIVSSAALADSSSITVTNQISSAPVTLTFGAFSNNSATFCKQPEIKTAAANNAVTFSFDPKTYCGSSPVTKLAVVATKSAPSTTTSLAATGSLVTISNPDAACTANGNISDSGTGITISLDTGNSQGCSTSSFNTATAPSTEFTGAATSSSISTTPAVPTPPSTSAIQ